MWFYKDHVGTHRDYRDYVFVSRIILEQMDAPVSMWFCTELYWYKWRPQCLGYSTKNDTGTNEVSSVYAVLQRIILVKLEISGSMWFWYK
jgi:hypothetical protein